MSAVTARCGMRARSSAVSTMPPNGTALRALHTLGWGVTSLPNGPRLDPSLWVFN